jgi:hypothetical protein
MYPARRRCESLKYLAIPALSCLAGRAPQHLKMQIYFCATPERRGDAILKRVWHVTVFADILCPCHSAFKRPGIPERKNSGFVFPRATVGSIAAGEWGLHPE